MPGLDYFIAQGDATAESIVEQWTRDQGPTATVKFRVSWPSRYVFMRALLGTWGVSPPAAYPDGSNALYCLDITDCRPVGGMTGVIGAWPTFKTAEITAFFGIPPYDWGGGQIGGGGDLSGSPWITTTFDISAEMLSLPDGAYYWEGSDKPVNDARIGKWIGQIGIRFKRKWAPRLSPLQMLNFAGKVNRGTFTMGDFSAPTETMLFLGGPCERVINTDLSWLQDTELNFVFRRTPNWNQLHHPLPGQGWQYINREKDGSDEDKRLFERVDFQPLFD